MKPNQIRQFLETVAEVKDLKPVTMGDRPPADETEVRYQGEWIEIDRYTNRTLGFQFVRLKDRHAGCELGCGEIVTNQTIHYQKYTYPQAHWKTKCGLCHKVVAPDGNGFIDGGGCTVNNIFARYFKDKNAK